MITTQTTARSLGKNNMILNDKNIQQLIKKISKQTAQKQKKVQLTKEEKDQEIRSANADEIFREMKKLPFSD
jgi:hypothetical protein